MRKNRKSRLISNLTVLQIDKLCSDMDKGRWRGSVEDWRAVAVYFRNRLDIAINDIAQDD